VTFGPIPDKGRRIMTSEAMEKRLREKYPDAEVAVLDMTGTENHFEVRIRSQALANLPRIAQHKAVMAVFAEELKTGEVHALAIKVMI
jgi:stress-induced morphogen